MIITKISGGLGNQMFQYAAGRATALKVGATLKLDPYELDKQVPKRDYNLGIFNISADLATRAEINKLRVPNNLLTQKSPRLFRFLSLRSKTYINELFFEGKIPQRDNLYLEGFWQSEIFFKDVESHIRKDFTFTKPLSAKGRNISKKIQAMIAVCIQVRRTDYVHRPKGARKIIGCSLQYYQHAIDYMNSRLKTPHFFVTSDDLGWCKKNIKSPHGKFDYFEVSDFEQMRLMSLCQHFIIANSSFGWWGAWLSANPKKIVISPEPWLEDGIHGNTVPAGWLKIPKR